jgi:hypothetical protein
LNGVLAVDPDDYFGSESGSGKKFEFNRILIHNTAQKGPGTPI